MDWKWWMFLFMYNPPINIHPPIYQPNLPTCRPNLTSNQSPCRWRIWTQVSTITRIVHSQPTTHRFFLIIRHTMIYESHFFTTSSNYSKQPKEISIQMLCNSGWSWIQIFLFVYMVSTRCKKNRGLKIELLSHHVNFPLYLEFQANGQFYLNIS